MIPSIQRRCRKAPAAVERLVGRPKKLERQSGRMPSGATEERKPRILVFIPTYRCEEQVLRVIDQFDDRVQSWVDTVLIVDNRSPDDTLDAAINRGRQRLRQCRFVAWLNDCNYGLGGSHKVAFRYAIDRGFDHLVVLHGDDQADVRDLIPRLEEGDHQQVDCLLGARFQAGSVRKGYSWVRNAGNRFYNLLFSVATGHVVHDLGSGLNLYRLAAFSDFHYQCFPDDLTFNYAMLLASYQRRQRVRFFPISWREEDQLSNVNLMRQAVRVLWLLARFFVGRSAFLAKDLRTAAVEAYSGATVVAEEPIVEGGK